MIRKILGIAAVSLVVLISITFYISSNDNPLSKETNISVKHTSGRKNRYLIKRSRSDAETCISEDQPQQLKTWQISTESEAYYANDALYLELESCVLISWATRFHRQTPKDEIRLTNGSETIRIFPADNIIEANGHSIRVLDSSTEDTFGAGCMRLGRRTLYALPICCPILFGLDVREDESGKYGNRSLEFLKISLTIDTERTDLTEGMLTAAIQYPVLSGPWNPAGT
jgi:hypothetical protein